MATAIEVLWEQATSATAPRDGAPVELTGAGSLDSAFAVSEFAAAAIAVAGRAVANLVGAPAVKIDRALACGWFGFAVAPVGWQLASPWDAIAGDYETRDGWIRLHTNAPAHKAAALSVLGLSGEVDRATVAAVVRDRHGDDLESRVVCAGGCAAVMRSAEEWAGHPQGLAVETEPLIATTPGLHLTPQRRSGAWRPTPSRPLDGLRVLDLTRIIAGPVATRFLAGFGARVLRIDPPGWEEPVLEVDMTLGKLTARLDLATPSGLSEFTALVADADVLVHGYRADALEKLGLSAEELQRISPGLIDVGINAYGFSGPWRNRRGFDSLVQMSTGIAAAGMPWAGSERPTPLPVQALDHATGYLAAAAVCFGLADRLQTGAGSSWRVSLARTALALSELSASVRTDRGQLAAASPLQTTPLGTPWGAARLLRPPVTVGSAAQHWDRGPKPLGSDEPRLA